LLSCYAHKTRHPRDTERALPTLTRRLSSTCARLRWYGLAVGLSALALVLMLILWPLMEPSVFFLFLAAVAVSAMYGGLGPGLAATTLSALAGNYFFLEPYDVAFSRSEGALRLLVFVSTGVIVSWLAEGHKKAKDGLRERNGYLEHWAIQRKELEARLMHEATHDHLTDLHNQAAFYEHLSRALARARRRRSKVAVMFVDLDDFKLVNDSLGHQEGNVVLREVAERLKESLREADVPARFGGDEFIVLLEDVKDAGEALKVAERFQERLRVPFEVDGGHRVYTSASIGIAVGSGEMPQRLVVAADEASYRAKRRGKARTAVFIPDSTTGDAP
jgi:diguanylate cyclase (GGDEF)-like protein